MERLIGDLYPLLTEYMAPIESSSFVGPDNEMNMRLQTILHPKNINMVFTWVAQNGHLDAVQYLLEHGADIYEECALECAAENGHLDIVKYLVTHGANVHANDNKTLYLAALNGHLEIVQYLCDNGSEYLNLHITYAFLMAAAMGHLKVVQYFVNMGAHIHFEDDRAMHLAAQHGHTDVVEYLKSLE